MALAGHRPQTLLGLVVDEQRGELELARVQFRPDGAVPFTSGSGASEGDEVSLTGRVYATDSGYGTWTSYGAV